MRKAFIAYLQNKWNIVLLVLGLIALTLFCALFFKPVLISDWISTYQTWLMWAEMGLLLLIILVMIHINSQLQTLLEKKNAPEEAPVSEELTMFNFYDERGDLKLSAKPETVYYLEAADNYVQIHYMNAGKMQSLLIRNSLKNIEWRFRDTRLIRCHRSFIVNLERVRLMRRVEGEIVLDFGEEKMPVIPVSKIYGTSVIKHFT